MAWDRTPGFGDTDWVKIIDILRRANFQGNINIEGYHDPVYGYDWEYTGQVHALNYLKRCRGGDYVPNPTNANIRKPAQKLQAYGIVCKHTKPYFKPGLPFCDWRMINA